MTFIKARGPGTQLHRIIKKLTGEGITAGCGCTSMIARMNANPPQWTRDNINDIINMMVKEVDRRLKEPEKTQRKIHDIEERQEQVGSERNRRVRENDDYSAQDQQIEQMARQLDRLDEQLQKNKKPGWQLKLGGLDLPGRRLAIRAMILRAVRRAEADLRNKEKIVG